MYFSQNLKYLRKRRKKSQVQLAAELDIKRTTLSGYEKNVQPPFRTLIKISEYFNVSLDAFIKYRIDTLSELQLSQIEKGHDIDVTGQKLRLLTISLDKDGEENIEMVPVKAQAGYTASYGDIDFIADLPKFNLPFLPKDKTYRTFQIKGESMLPIKEGAWVTCSYLQNWNDIKDGKPYVVVTKDDGIVFKLVYKQEEDGRFLLVSSNPDFSPYEIAVSEILEMWKFETINNFELE